MSACLELRRFYIFLIDCSDDELLEFSKKLDAVDANHQAGFTLNIQSRTTSGSTVDNAPEA